MKNGKGDISFPLTVDSYNYLCMQHCGLSPQYYGVSENSGGHIVGSLNGDDTAYWFSISF